MTNEPARQTTREVLPEDVDANDPDIVFGLAAIGARIGKTEKETQYLLRHTNLLDGVVKRISRKVTISSKRRLDNLAITALARD